MSALASVYESADAFIDRLATFISSLLPDDHSDASPRPLRSAAAKFDREHVFEGAATINGVALPQRVIDELRRLGLPLSWYNHGELEEAVEACAFDGQLIDDSEGITLRDKLHLTAHEQQTRIRHAAVETQDAPPNNDDDSQASCCGELSFCEMVIERRKKNRSLGWHGDEHDL